MQKGQTKYYCLLTNTTYHHSHSPCDSDTSSQHRGGLLSLWKQPQLAEENHEEVECLSWTCVGKNCQYSHTTFHNHLSRSMLQISRQTLLVDQRISGIQSLPGIQLCWGWLEALILLMNLLMYHCEDWSAIRKRTTGSDNQVRSSLALSSFSIPLYLTHPPLLAWAYMHKLYVHECLYLCIYVSMYLCIYVSRYLGI